MAGVIIGVDPHKLSATIEVVDHHGLRLGSGRYATHRRYNRPADTGRAHERGPHNPPLDTEGSQIRAQLSRLENNQRTGREAWFVYEHDDTAVGRNGHAKLRVSIRVPDQECAAWNCEPGIRDQVKRLRARGGVGCPANRRGHGALHAGEDCHEERIGFDVARLGGHVPVFVLRWAAECLDNQDSVVMLHRELGGSLCQFVVISHALKSARDLSYFARSSAVALTA